MIRWKTEMNSFLRNESKQTRSIDGLLMDWPCKTFLHNQAILTTWKKFSMIFLRRKKKESSTLPCIFIYFRWTFLSIDDAMLKKYWLKSLIICFITKHARWWFDFNMHRIFYESVFVFRWTNEVYSIWKMNQINFEFACHHGNELFSLTIFYSL